MAKTPDLRIPSLGIRNWTVFGIDLSLSRTGHACLSIQDGVARWVSVGSISPKDSSEETWKRGKAIAQVLRDTIKRTITEQTRGTVEPHGVIISVEFPDPENSYLMALNGIVQETLWPVLAEQAKNIALFRLAINAATLRSVLRLGAKGKGDKSENMAMAYEYIDRKDFPKLDSDSCDAVLLAMMGRHAAMVQSGHEELVPVKPKTKLCTTAVRRKEYMRKGEVVRVVETPEALLHNPATWTEIRSPLLVDVSLSDARSTARGGQPAQVSL